MGEFVEPDIVRIPLSGENRWIEVKRELNAGEYDAMNASVIKDTKAGELPILDYEKVMSFKILAYLVGWSFTDSAGKSVPVSAAAIANLKKATRDELSKLVEAHELSSNAIIEERKNGDAPESPAVSTSVER